MSLLKLLSVSKSFTTGKNQPGRYRMAEQGLLPKFAPVGRPVSLAPEGKIGELPQQGGSTFSAVDDPRSTATLSLRQSCERHSPYAQPDWQSITPLAADSRGAVCANAVSASINWFRLRKNSVRNGQVEKPISPVPVQAQLALEAVKPVRNDLSDVDFEVVPLTAMKKSMEQKSGRLRLFKTEVAGMAWNRLTARLF